MIIHNIFGYFIQFIYKKLNCNTYLNKYYNIKINGKPKHNYI